MAIFETKGKLVEKTYQRVDTRTKNAIANQIVTLIITLCKRIHIETRRLRGAGIASTRPLESKKGELIEPVHLPFDKVPLKKPITLELLVRACSISSQRLHRGPCWVKAPSELGKDLSTWST